LSRMLDEKAEEYSMGPGNGRYQGFVHGSAVIRSHPPVTLGWTRRTRSCLALLDRTLYQEKNTVKDLCTAQQLLRLPHRHRCSLNHRRVALLVKHELDYSGCSFPELYPFAVLHDVEMVLDVVFHLLEELFHRLCEVLVSVARDHVLRVEHVD
jgi:hypothetical protein